jgi:hypothetical protein
MPIQRGKDPMLVELERIAKTQLAIPCSFIHANLFEANFGIDQISRDSEQSFPVLIHVANGKNKNDPNTVNDIRRKASVFLLLLTKFDAPTSDYKSYEVNELVYQMQQLGNNLQYWINKSPLSINGGVTKDSWSMVDVYQKFDAHLFGQAIEFTWEFDTGKSGHELNRAY